MKGRIRLVRVCDYTPSEVAERIRRGLLERHACEGRVRKNHAQLALLEHERHFWSPWLDLEIRSQGSGTRLDGAFGPNPEVWTMFVFLWASMVAVWTFGGLFGVGQWMVGEDPVGLRYSALATVGLVVSCGVNIAGQRGTVDQQAILSDFLDDVLGLDGDEGDLEFARTEGAE